MAYTSEIEKLEARYRENPKGRNFAPLADAYRKAGLVDNAIELCQAGLQLHPDYVSGHIVHGRCLVDKKDDTAADAVFRRVLELDPENILALKVLAEIAERNERFDTAAEWLDRLLMADPMNGEAAEGLTRVRAKAAAAPAAPAEPPAPIEEPAATLLMEDAPGEVVHEEADAATAPMDSAPEPAELNLERVEEPFDASVAEGPTTEMDRPEFELERASEPATPPPSVGGEIEVFDGAVDFNAVTEDAAPPEGIQLEEPLAVEAEPDVVVEGLARTQYEGSGLFEVDAAASEPAPAPPPEVRASSPTSDLPLIMPEDVAPEAEPLPEPEPAATPEPEAVPEPEPEPVGASAPPSPPPIPQLPDDDGAADTETLSRAEPVVTETMAELYLQQGHRDDARRVYEALSAQHPDDVRLRSKAAELAGAPVAKGSGQSAGAFLKSILQARPGAPAPVLPPAPPVLEQGEEAGVNGDSQPAVAPGSPTRPASDAISLDSVFGEESARGAAAAASEPPSEKAARLPAASGGFSFDDFFGTSAAPGAAANDSGEGRPSRHSGRGRGAEQEEDLDQFQAWLKSLKA